MVVIPKAKEILFKIMQEKTIYGDVSSARARVSRSSRARDSRGPRSIWLSRDAC